MNNPTREKGPDVSHHIQGPESKERNSIVFQNQLIRKPQTNAMEVDGERSPVVDVELNLPAAMTVSWACAFCKQRHSHGAPYAWLEPLGAIVGHRLCQCFSNDSPLLGRSYYMRLAGTHETPPQPKRRHPRVRKNDFVILSAEQARQVMRRIAAHDDRYALVTIGPDDPVQLQPYGLGSPRTMTIAVPACGIYLGSLLAEVALLPEGRGRTLTVDERLRRDAKIRKTALATLRSVNAAAQMVLQ